LRTLDALRLLLVTLSRRTPVLLMLDDLHWADGDTLAALRYLAHFATKERILIIGAYRDVDLRWRPLAKALRELQREAQCIVLRGLEAEETGALLSALVQQQVPEPFVQAIQKETDGNPFYVREVLLAWVQDRPERNVGRLAPDHFSAASLRIPSRVRNVIQMRVSRLSDAANRMLIAASAIDGGFRFAVVVRAADLQSEEALDAIDEALESRLIQPHAEPDTYDFAHANIRHTLYGALSSSRRIRVHRRLAEAIEAQGSLAREQQASALAYHFHRSAALPGSERGADYALVASEQARKQYGWEQVVTYLRIAISLLPEHDERRLGVLDRLAESLIRTLDGEGALRIALEAASRMQGRQRDEFFARVARQLFLAGFRPQAWELATEGLRHLSTSARDQTWIILHTLDLHCRRGFDPENLGLVIETDSLREIELVVATLPPLERARVTYVEGLVPRRADHASILAADIPAEVAWLGGCQFRRQLERLEVECGDQQRRGSIPGVAMARIAMACAHIGLGQLDAARTRMEEARPLIARLHDTATAVHSLGYVSDMLLHLTGARFDQPWTAEVDGHWAEMIDDPLHRYLGGPARTTLAFLAAQRGDVRTAVEHVTSALPAIEHGAPGVTSGEPNLYFMGIAALHHLDRSDHADLIERNMRQKWLESDIRYPDCEPRLAMARLCSVQRRMDEALEWFSEARALYDSEEWRPLRAICDYDEALSLARTRPRDRKRIEMLLDEAQCRMNEMGMVGWLRRAKELRSQLSAKPVDRIRRIE
jgi:hypothetical protein